MNYNNDTEYYRSLSDFIFKSVHPFVWRYVTYVEALQSIASALLWRKSAEGVHFFRIFGYEAYPQHHDMQCSSNKND
jgi:trehalose utilization protein